MVVLVSVVIFIVRIEVLQSSHPIQPQIHYHMLIFAVMVYTF